MAKIRLADFRTDLTNDMSELLEKYNENIHRAVYRVKADRLTDTISRSKRLRGKITIPQLDEVLPKRSISTKKVKEQGKIISQTLYDRLSKDLRDTLDQEQWYQAKGGRAGSMRKGLQESLQERMKETFESYTGKTPGNLRNIVVTESRSALNEINRQFMARLMRKNPHLKGWKVWVQNRAWAKHPRTNHSIGALLRSNPKGKRMKWGVGVPLNEQFTLQTKSGIIKTDGPHDATLPAEEVVGCNCEQKYYLEV